MNPLPRTPCIQMSVIPAATIAVHPRTAMIDFGADAVIFVRYGTVGVSFMSWGSLNGKGRAIVFLD